MIVQHLVDSWPAVLRQRQYIQTLSGNPDLVAALKDTYAAHVHNALGAVLVMDVFRAVGAHILDRNSKAASIVNAVELLGRQEVLGALIAELADVKPGRFVDEAAARALRKVMGDHAEGFYRDARADLDWIRDNLLSSDLARTLRTVRDKGVAHYELVREGDDWRLWRIEGTGLTYGQLDQFIDCCTEAIDRLAHLALRQSHAWDLEAKHAERYADEYVQALVFGLQHAKRRPATSLSG